MTILKNMNPIHLDTTLKIVLTVKPEIYILNEKTKKFELKT